MKTTPNLAPSKAAWLASLFVPVNGRTYDGYIVGPVKGIRLTCMAENYVLNHDGVFCLATVQPDGRTWYSYGGALNSLPMSERATLAQSIRAATLNREAGV